MEISMCLVSLFDPAAVNRRLANNLAGKGFARLNLGLLLSVGEICTASLTATKPPELSPVPSASQTLLNQVLALSSNSRLQSTRGTSRLAPSSSNFLSKLF